MTFLIDKGADVNAQNAFGTTALMMSATDIGEGAAAARPWRQAEPREQAGTHGAVHRRDERRHRRRSSGMLIAKGADVRGKDAFQNTTLTAAAYGNDLDTIRLILDAGVDVNAAGVTGVTPLLGAALQRQPRRGAAAPVQGRERRTPSRRCPRCFPLDAPKSGPIALTDVTPLLAAAAAAPPELDQGAARRRRQRQRQGRPRHDAADAGRRHQPSEPGGHPPAAGARRRRRRPEQCRRDGGRLGAQAGSAGRRSSC